MKKISIKKYRNKRRNVKKYKKSQKNGKTRRCKISKNIKRHYSLRKGKGIRRHMRGGDFTFTINDEDLKVYVNKKYGQKFTRLQQVASGNVAITKRFTSGLLRKYNRGEKLIVSACYNTAAAIAEINHADAEAAYHYAYETTGNQLDDTVVKARTVLEAAKTAVRDAALVTDDEIVCYVIARCESRFSCADSLYNYRERKNDNSGTGMEKEILFVDYITKPTIDKNDKDDKALDHLVTTEAKLDNKKLDSKPLTKEDCNLFTLSTLKSDPEFKPREPGNRYRVIILPENDELLTFFTAQAKLYDDPKVKFKSPKVDFVPSNTSGNGAAAATGAMYLTGFLPT